MINGFDWNQNFGTDECWLAVFEESHESHRTATQCFVSIREHNIRYGLLYGDQHPNRGQQDLSIVQDIDLFTYGAFQSKMMSLAASFKPAQLSENPNGNEGIRGIPSNEISVEKWVELLQNRDVFKPGDLVYIHQMYEMGGEASATELANALGRHFSSFNAPVVQLAKRVQEFTGTPPIRREDGTEYYWGILFDQGSQYTSHAYHDMLPQVAAQISMSRRGHCIDNASMESFFSHLKTEGLYPYNIRTLDEAQSRIIRYIDFYNEERPQRKLKKLTPVEYRRQFSA